jgi:hypothetical protein
VQQLALLLCLHICTAVIASQCMSFKSSPAALLLCGGA